MENNDKLKSLRGKLLITGTIKLETGMHIGASNDFAPIGSVDTPFIRDVVTQEPIIPGSSIKGKLRTLLAKSHCDVYIMSDIKDDKEEIKTFIWFRKSCKASSVTVFMIYLSQMKLVNCLLI